MEQEPISEIIEKTYFYLKNNIDKEPLPFFPNTIMEEIIIGNTFLREKVKEYSFYLRKNPKYLDSVINEYRKLNQYQNIENIVMRNMNYFLNKPLVNEEYIRSIMFEYMLFEFDYCRFKNKYFNTLNSIKKNRNYLEKYYYERGIDLRKMAPQYDKYGLIPIGNTFHLEDDCYLMERDDTPRIYDVQQCITIFLLGIDNNLYRYLLKLKNKYLFEISLKPNLLNFKRGLYKKNFIRKHFEYGGTFSFQNLHNIEPSKLYNENYDTLWITKNNNDITFEEIENDNSIEVYNDFFITQVIHLQYSYSKNTPIITHIDHEYVFYLIEEFENRKKNPLQKGNGKKRIKTFKIDNGAIPMFEENGRNILYDILDIFIKNKDLLEEYFSSII